MDSIPTKKVTVTIQKNGIIRGPDNYLIARLENEIDFNSSHLAPTKLDAIIQDNGYPITDQTKYRLEQLIAQTRLEAQAGMAKLNPATPSDSEQLPHD